jgi:hypothetical protein
VRNYVNYFTEIEEHFQRRRGTLLLLSTLDWALIETWQEAGIPLPVVLRGIDDAFDKYEVRQRTHPGRKQRRVNGLAWCAQAIIEAAEQQREAAIGMTDGEPSEASAQSGLEADRIAVHLRAAAAELAKSAIATDTCAALAQRLQALAETAISAPSGLEELERQLTVLEEKLFAALTTCAPEDLLVTLKAEAARELAGYRSRMSAVQLRQIEQQFVRKRLLEHYNLPRLSLFYMRQS